MKHLIFMLVVSFIYTSSFAQVMNQAAIEKQIDTLFDDLNSKTSPGVAISILQNNKVTVRKNYGSANLEHGIPFTHQSPVRLTYSFGREFTCVGAALMEAEGLLSFSDKVKKYFPKLPEWSKNVTIQDLLNHSSGFVDEWSIFGFVTEDMRSNLEVEQVLTLLYNQPQPEVEPGKGYMYNNTDIGLLRLILDKVSQHGLPDYLNEKLFTPLGMTQTFMNDNIEQIIPGFAEDYYGRPPYRKGRWYKFSPGGNYRMVTSANDLEKWVMAIEDKNSLVTKAYTRLYQNARPIPVVSPERLYVFGHEWHTINNTEVIKYGGLGDFYIVRIPSLQVSMVVLGNSGNHFDPATELFNSFLPLAKESKEKPTRFFPDQPMNLKKDELEKYTGLYLEQTFGYNSHFPSIQLFSIKLDGDSLAVYSDNRKEFNITDFGNGYFKFMQANAMMKFTKVHPDSAMKWEAWQENDIKPREFIRAETSVVMDENYIKQFTGKYRSTHLDYYFNIQLNEQGQLIIKRPTVRDVVLIPHSNGRFIMEGKTGAYSVYSWVIFNRNKQGNIDGFIINDSRLMQHRFEKVEIKDK